MYNDDQSPSAVNPLPFVVVILATVIAAIEIVFWLGSTGLFSGPEGALWRGQSLQSYAFFPQIFTLAIETGNFQVTAPFRVVTYAFVHYSFVSALFSVVFILALGKMVAEIFHWAAFLAVFFVSVIVGAVGYAFILPDGAPLVGAFTGAYGIIGAYTFILWVGLGIEGANRAQAFQLIAILLGIQLVFEVIFGGQKDWIADMIGFATGFLLSFVVSPGGINRVLAKMRRG